MPSYRVERECFALLRKLPRDILAEYERAFSVLVERYNTTIHENRFVVGGAIEVFTLFLLRAAGIDADAYGAQTASGDIILPNNKMLSVKASLTGRPADIRLINTMGDGDTEWTTATLFVLSGTGIVYGDPSMASDDDLHRTKDALLLRRSAVARLAAHPTCKLGMNLVSKPPTRMTRFSHKASTAVAKQILFEQKAAVLLRQAQS